MTFAGNASIFSYDADELNTEFSELQVMETMIITNQNLTITDFERMDADWLSYIDLGAMKVASPVQAMFGFNDLDLVSFAWGFCCCPVGFFTIINNENKSSDEKTSFWFGVLGGTVLGYYPALVLIPLQILLVIATAPVYTY